MLYTISVSRGGKKVGQFLYLHADQHAELHAEAARSGEPLSAIVREGVDREIARRRAEREKRGER